MKIGNYEVIVVKFKIIKDYYVLENNENVNYKDKIVEAIKLKYEKKGAVSYLFIPEGLNFFQHLEGMGEEVMELEEKQVEENIEEEFKNYLKSDVSYFKEITKTLIEKMPNGK